MSVAQDIARHMDSEASRFTTKARLRAQAIANGFGGAAVYCDYEKAARQCQQIAEWNRKHATGNEEDSRER